MRNKNRVRIECPGSYYRVMEQGNRRKPIAILLAADEIPYSLLEYEE